MVRSLSIITLSIIASMSLSLSVSAAPPPTPVGEFAGGTFAEYFRRAVSYPCNNLYYMRGFISTPGDNYMKPDCVLGQNIDKWDLSGNAGTNPATNYIGTQDSQGLSIRTNSIERMFIGTDGNMGIGISVPAVRLHVNTTANEVARFQSSNNPLISLYKNSVRKAYIYQDGNNNTTIANEGTGGLNFFSNGAYRLNIGSNGNIGIGTTTPLADLEIRRNDTDSSLLFHDPSNAWYSMGIDVSDARKFKINYGSGVGDSTHFTMTSIGNVGIGTSTPGAKLEVNGGIYVLGGNGDLDGNNATNNSDAIEIGKWIAGTRVLTPAEYARADINGDGKVNRIDQNLISQIVIGLLTIDEARNDYGKRMESIVGWDVFNGYSVTPNKIGIGVTNPSAKLHVNGNALFQGNVTISGSLRVTGGTPLSGQVLTALDGLGNTAWQEPGVQFTTNTWIRSKPDTIARLFFANGDRTYFGSDNGYTWRNKASNVDLLTLVEEGDLFLHRNLSMNGTIRTRAVYDHDDTGYLVDPNGSSQLSAVFANNWFRAQGDSGLYFQDFGGGFRMTDPTWIRTYGGKNFYHDIGVMRTDGTFQVGGGGATFSVENGGNLAYRTNVLFASTAGNVGIGTNVPEQNLEIYKDNADSTIRFHDPGDAWFSMGIDRSDSGKFKINYGGTLGDFNHFTMTNGGNVGIGTNAPGAKLDVLSTVPEVTSFSSTTPNVFFSLFGAGEQKGIISSTGGNMYVNNRVNGGSLFLGTRMFPSQLMLSPSGVGIGVETPTASLDIEGSIRLRDGAGVGKVLTSDADGNASWQSISASNTTNVTNNIPSGYIEKDWNFDEDVYGGIVAAGAAEADTCNSDKINPFSCTASTVISCVDRTKIPEVCGSGLYGGWECFGGEEQKRNVVCKKSTFLVKLSTNCSTVPACNGWACNVNIGTPTSTDQAFVKGAASCGFTCINGYSGANCEIAPCEKINVPQVTCGPGNYNFAPTNPKNSQLYMADHPYRTGTAGIYFCEPALPNANKDLWISKFGNLRDRNSAGIGKPYPVGTHSFWRMTINNGGNAGPYYVPPIDCNPGYENPGGY